jgi:hypothetical protein
MSRRFAVRVLKAVFVVSAVSFVAVQLHLRAASPNVDQPPAVVAAPVDNADLHPKQRVVNGLNKPIVSLRYTVANSATRPGKKLRYLIQKIFVDLIGQHKIC